MFGFNLRGGGQRAGVMNFNSIFKKPNEQELLKKKQQQEQDHHKQN